MDDRGSVLPRERERARRVEGLLQHERPSRAERGEQGGEPEDVRQRDDAQRSIIAVQPQLRRRGEGGPHQVVVREDDPLRSPRRPGRVQNRARIPVRVHVRRRDFPTAAARDEVLELEDPVVVPEILLSDRHHVLKVRQPGEEVLEPLEIIHPAPVLGRNRDGGLGIPERETELARRTVRTDGHENGARFRDREGRDHELGPVGQLDGDAVSGFDSQVVKPHGQGAGLRRDAGIAPRPVARPHAGRVRTRLRVSGEETGDAERGGR